MSGIVGLYNPHSALMIPNELARMTHALSHRGPDGSTAWANERVGLGHLALHDTPESKLENQPLSISDNQLVLVSDARIDNRGELISQLGLSQKHSDISDSAIILKAYERWGESCPEHLLGDFAFAIWDARKNHLFCARDHIGLKPFYYASSGTAFAFASEIKPLLTLEWVQRHINEIRVADYLMNLIEDKEATFYEGILRLPPAHSITVTPVGISINQYWSLDPNREIHFGTDEDYAEQFRELFVESVRCRTRSANPIGSFLSGGLDSSSVTCVAREFTRRSQFDSLNTFSLIFDEESQSDERPFINAVLDQGGFDAHYVHGDTISQLEDLDSMLHHADEPFITPNLFLYWNLYRLAQASGVRIILDGFLGDSVVSHGSRYLTQLAATGHWFQLIREINSTSKVLGRGKRTMAGLVKQFVLTPLINEPAQRAWRALTKTELPANPFSRFINKDFARGINWIERARKYKTDSPRTTVNAQKEHYEELTDGSFPAALEVINKASSAFGVTPRFPFADRRLIEYCLAVPVTQKYRNGWTRVIQRNALRDYLPEKIYNRYGKTYLNRIFNRSLFMLGRQELDSIIHERLQIAEHWVNVEAIQQEYDRIKQAPTHDPYPPNNETSLAIWYAVILTRWLELER